MSVATRTDEVLKALEEELARHPYMASGEAGGDPSLHLSERIRDVRRVLSTEEPRWIGIPMAARLLGLRSEQTVRAWIASRLLQSRTQANGEVQVLLDNVLRNREAAEGLTAFGGRELTEEEVEAEHRARPGTAPWERPTTDRPK
jgi:hypothetical protein